MNGTLAPSGSRPAAPGRMATGIAGLDYLLEGGLVRGNSLLIEGPPGSGKSTLGVRILYEGAVQFDEPGLIISFEEFPRQIYEESLSYGLDLRALEEAGKLRVVWTSPARILEGFRGKNDLIEKIIADLGVRRLLIDSITHFRRVSNAEVDLREMLAGLLNVLKIKGVNALMVKELERMDEATIAFEEYLVDASLRVHNMPGALTAGHQRFLEIRKTRGQGHISGFHPLAFTPAGLKVFPNWRPQDVGAFFADSATPHGAIRPADRIPTGIEGLDAMLAGGLQPGSVNIVNGLSGTGKSVVGYHFLNAGLEAGENCLLVNYRMPLDQITAQAASLGMDWRRPIDEGRMEILRYHTVNLCVEEMMDDLIQRLRGRRIARFFFDGIDDLWMAVRNDERARDDVDLIGHLFRTRGATTLMTHERSVTAAASSSGAGQDYAGMANTIIQLSMAESDGEIRRFVGVWKHAGSEHAKELREFRIDSAGFHVHNKAAGLSGILTGQTSGAMKQIADQVLPTLDDTVRMLAAVMEQGKAADNDDKIARIRANVGLLDILLREHFGETQFRKLAEEMTQNP